MYYKKKVHKYLSIFQLSRKSETRFFKRIKLRTYWRPSRKIFSMNYTKVNNFLKKYPAKEVEQVLWNRVFFWTKEKDWIQSLKQNLTTFTWNKLFYFLRSNKSKIWDCFRSKAWIIWLCKVCICWFCVIIFFFLQVYWSKFAMFFKFFSKNNQPPLNNIFYFAFYHQRRVLLSPLYVFLCFQIFQLLFYHF